MAAAGSGVAVGISMRRAVGSGEGAAVAGLSISVVMAGAAIYTALMEHPGNVTVIVTALAASAASIIAMAGDRILMHPVAYMMIHNPWTIAMGDAKELRKAAKTLDVIAEGLVSTYQVRTGKDREELKKMLENETWMSAVTCIEEGFADAMVGADPLKGETIAASASRPTLMSMKAHGVQEITARIPDAEEADREEENRKRTEIANRARIAAEAMDAAMR